MVLPFNPPTTFTDQTSFGGTADGDTADRYPWYSPSKSKAEAGDLLLFPEEPTDADFVRRYERYQLAKVIVSDVPEDAVRNGFGVRHVLSDSEGITPDPEFNLKFQKVYRDIIFAPFLKGLKLCRLFGYCPLMIGYKENLAGEVRAKLGLPPNSETPTLIEYLQPLKKPIVTLNTTDTLPKEVLSIQVSTSKKGEPKRIDKSRFIMIENESISDDREGMSSLLPVWDLLTVQKHADWSIGQDLWRGASGLLTLFAAPGATSADATAALEAVDNLTAKTRVVLPPGWDAKDISPTRSSYNVKFSYEIVVQQIAAGTRIPFYVLSPVSYGKRKDDLMKEYESFLFSYQTAFLSPILTQIFKKFQVSKQLPEGSFEIIWNPSLESPYQIASEKYMESLSRKADVETIQKEKTLIETRTENAKN